MFRRRMCVQVEIHCLSKTSPTWLNVHVTVTDSQEEQGIKMILTVTE